MGYDLSATASFGKHWYLGDAKDITAAMFSGFRTELNGSVSVGVDIGASISYSSTDTGYGTISASETVGFGMPFPFPVSGNFNVGYTHVWGQ